jgi:quinol monooxygenase YgiN
MSALFMLAKLKAKAGSESAMEKELKALVEATHSEPGCLLYALHRDSNDFSQFVVIERFLSKEALDSHYASPHFSKHFSSISPLLASEPEIIHLSSVGEGKKGQLFE